LRAYRTLRSGAAGKVRPKDPRRGCCCVRLRPSARERRCTAGRRRLNSDQWYRWDQVFSRGNEGICGFALRPRNVGGYLRYHGLGMSKVFPTTSGLGMSELACQHHERVGLSFAPRAGGLVTTCPAWRSHGPTSSISFYTVPETGTRTASDRSSAGVCGTTSRSSPPAGGGPVLLVRHRAPAGPAGA